MSLSWSQQGWQVSPSWKYSTTVFPCSAARSKVPSAVEDSAIGGAISPGPGRPTADGYLPAWPAEPFKKLLTKKITPSTTTAAVMATATFIPDVRRHRRRRDRLGDV